MTPRFAVRWTLIGLLAVLPLLALAYLLSLLQPAPPSALRKVSVDDLLSAAEMPLDATGSGTQIISGTTLTLQVQPYPPPASVVSTVTLVAITSDGKLFRAANPRLWVTLSSESEPREYPMLLRDEGSYSASGMLLPTRGQYRMRVDVYLGDPVPANMIFSVQAR